MRSFLRKRAIAKTRRASSRSAISRGQALLRKTAKQQTAGQAPHGVTPGSIQRRNELGEDESVKSCIRSIYTNITNKVSFYILVRPGLAQKAAGFCRAETLGSNKVGSTFSNAFLPQYGANSNRPFPFVVMPALDASRHNCERAANNRSSGRGCNRLHRIAHLSRPGFCSTALP